MGVLSWGLGVNVLEKFVRKGKRVFVKDFRIDPTRPMTMEQWDQLFWAERDSYLWAVSCGHFRSVLVDTGTGLWEAQRMEAFGKLTQVPPLKYGEVNGQFEAVLNYAKGFPVNVMFTHRMKAEYANDATGRRQKTGAMANTGYSGIGYVAQVEVQQVWHPELKCPAMKVVGKCRPNPYVIGHELYDKQCTFQGLAKLIYPDSDPKAWTDGVEV